MHFKTFSSIILIYISFCVFTQCEQLTKKDLLGRLINSRNFYSNSRDESNPLYDLKRDESMLKRASSSRIHEDAQEMEDMKIARRVLFQLQNLKDNFDDDDDFQSLLYKK